MEKQKPRSKADVGKLFANGPRVLRMIAFEERPTFTLKDLDTDKIETWAVGSIQDECFRRLIVEGDGKELIP
jgi:hypothetical protein